MASQEGSASNKLPYILAGASVAVSTTVAALAVWWASKSREDSPGSSTKSSKGRNGSSAAGEKWEDVRSFLWLPC